MSRLKTINLKVPDGAEAGDSLTFSLDGKELEFRIPDNSKPGDVLQIQIQVEGDANDDDEHDGENGVTIVALHSSIGASLEIHDCIPGGSPADGECEDEEPSPLDNTKEAQGNVSDGTSSMVWPAGLHLAKFISSPQFDEKLNICDNVKHVVELGSGSGLCGLALAATASSKLSKRKHDAKKLKIILTDVPKSMNLLKYNIESNMDKLSSHLEEENLCARPLTWGNVEDANALDLSDVDLILGSDLLYNVTAKTFKDLSASINTLDSSGKSTIVLSVRWRKPEEERRFFQEMEHLGYNFHLLVDDASEKQFRCDLGWKDFGNPKSQESNDFFTNSYVQVDGESKPLKDISEDDMDIMSDSEFNLFEKRFIQVYIGKKKHP